MSQGYELDFVAVPPLSFDPPPQAVTKEDQAELILPFIPVWSERGVVREIFTRELFYSRMFTVPKPEVEVRPIIDLHILNQMLNPISFRMNAVDKIVPMLPEGLWAIKVDIKDAYFHVPMAWEMHKYLAFKLKDRVFVFQVLPFGLSPAPWAFSRVMKPIRKSLSLQEIMSFYFLDDWIVVGQSEELTADHGRVFVELLQRLGLQVNWKKSQLTPRRSLEYLGVWLDLQRMEISLPWSKQQTLVEDVKHFRRLSSTSRRELERLVGFLLFAARLVPLGRTLLHPITMWMNCHTSPELRDLQVPLDQNLRNALSQWLDPSVVQAGVPMRLPLAEVEMMTDASDNGWCGVLLPRTVEGIWSQEEALLPINWKELKAVHLSLLHLASEIRGKSVTLHTDSSTVVWCIKNQGTSRSSLLQILTREILVWCREMKITLLPSHLKGALNVIADQGSRSGPIQAEWSLDPMSFWKICSWWGTPQVDLFATRDNKQLDVFVSPCPDSTAWSMDALSQDWNVWESVYLFPPWALLPQIVPLLESYSGTGFLIAPLWTTRPWYLPLVKRCREVVPLPSDHYLFQNTSEGRLVCDRTKFFSLHVWRL